MNSIRSSQCFECETGTYKDVTVNYYSQLSDGRGCVTKNVTISRCDSCGAEIFDSKASQLIENNIKRLFPDYYERSRTKRTER